MATPSSSRKRKNSSLSGGFASPYSGISGFKQMHKQKSSEKRHKKKHKKNHAVEAMPPPPVLEVKAKSGDDAKYPIKRVSGLASFQQVTKDAVPVVVHDWINTWTHHQCFRSARALLAESKTWNQPNPIVTVCCLSNDQQLPDGSVYVSGDVETGTEQNECGFQWALERMMPSDEADDTPTKKKKKKKKKQKLNDDAGDHTRFYLAQCPILSEPGPDNDPAILPELAPKITLPPGAETDVAQVNLWLSPYAVRSRMHYDARHGLLCVFKGTKTVLLYPPCLTSNLRPNPVSSTSPNYCSPMTLSLTDSLKAQGAVQVVVEANECLVIPEGWWHEVASTPGTIAVNLWLHGWGSRTRNMDAEYILRTSARNLTQREVQRMLQASTSSFAYMAVEAKINLLWQRRRDPLRDDVTANDDDDDGGDGLFIQDILQLLEHSNTVYDQLQLIRTLSIIQLAYVSTSLQQSRHWNVLVAAMDGCTATLITQRMALGQVVVLDPALRTILMHKVNQFAQTVLLKTISGVLGV